jgi:nucleoside-diphosphate-sugar epimerase
MKSKHIVLGAGPLGTATLEALQRQSVPALLVSRRRPEGLAASVSHRSLDLRDVVALAALLQGCETAYFCAAPPYHLWHKEFPALQMAALQASNKARCALVIADNLYGYSLPGAGAALHEGSPLIPATRKGRVRALMAATALAAHHAGDVRVAILRASDVFGPRVRNSALGERIWPALLAGKMVRFSGDPDQPHSYAYIDDFAAALVDIGLRDGGWGRTWHVPHQPLMSTRALLERAALRHGLPLPRIAREGAWTLRLAGLFIPAAREVIEMLPQFGLPYAVDDRSWLSQRSLAATPLDEALDDTLRWFSDSVTRSAGRIRTASNAPDRS